MTRRQQVAATAIVVLGIMVGAFGLLPRLSFFRVRQLEIEGLRYLAPEQVVLGLGLATRHSLLSRLGPVERRIEQMAGVVEARVSRGLPGTLRVQVVEKVPVAFAPGPAGMVPLDAEGRPLPYDPAVTGIDLPVIGRNDRTLLAVLARVQAADSALYRDVESARTGPRQTVILELGERRVMVSSEATDEDIQAVGTVRRYLSAGGRAYAELDARFEGWVVVRRTGT